ncbi:MAG: hypothetical protein II797_01120 [Clostridia bacterium]|nr:hypothetical protein [Clostridia bacterium]
MAEKTVFEVRMDPELYGKMEEVAASSGQTLNNYILSLVRSNVAYYEKVHGKIKSRPGRPGVG